LGPVRNHLVSDAMPKVSTFVYKAIERLEAGRRQAPKLASSVGFLVLVAAIAPSSGRAVTRDKWASPYFQDHPLAGTIWTSDFEEVTLAQLETALANARFVLLGEIHNNPDHHRLQAQLIDVLVKKGGHPAIVFEMIPGNLQGELNRLVEGGVGDANKLGKALRWEERGWPDWTTYQPIAETALSAGLPLVAGGLDADVQKAVGKGAPAQLYDQTVQDLDLAQPLQPEIAKAEVSEIKEGHCNLLPTAALEPMLRVQRALDASLAKAMMSANASDGAVLIAGADHVRNDWAVSHLIRQKMTNPAVVSVAFIEVDPERTTPSAYMKKAPGLEKPFDFIYLTPRAELTDHCADFEKQLKAKKAKTTGER
jgi:uncharacterized iron-regulated protein